MIEDIRIETKAPAPATIAVLAREPNPFLARYQAMQQRIAAALGKRPLVIHSAYDCVDDLPVDNLDTIAIEGRCRFEQLHDPYWGDGAGYRSDEIEHPTWLQVACLADAMISTTGDHHHVFLEGVRRVRQEGEVTIYCFVMGS